MEKYTQNNEFLQSASWSKFQESVGRKIFHLESENPASSAGKFSASLIEHTLPIVGKYLYCPRGPKTELSSDSELSSVFGELINLAKKENAGWIRIEPENVEILELIKENISEKIMKAPHDVQPKEVFVLDISKSQEQLLSEMKPKTRYNINLAKKKEIIIFFRMSNYSLS